MRTGRRICVTRLQRERPRACMPVPLRRPWPPSKASSRRWTETFQGSPPKSHHEDTKKHEEVQKEQFSLCGTESQWAPIKMPNRYGKHPTHVLLFFVFLRDLRVFVM